MPEETKVEDNKVDSYLSNLLSGMGTSVEQVLEPKEGDGGDGHAAPEKKTPTEEEKAAAAKAAETPEQKSAREKSEADAKAVEDAKTAEAAKSKIQDAPVRPVVLAKKEAPKQKEEDATEKKSREEEEAFIAGLHDEQRDELEIASFAESKGKVGLRQKFLDYYRKLDKYAEENEDADPSSEKFAKFKEENEPKLTPSERRRLERDMITERATSKAREEVTKEFEPVVRKLNEIETAPVLKGAVVSAVETLSKKPSNDHVPFDAEVVSKIQNMPYSQAAEEFPVEAPIVAGTLNAVKEWTRIRSGVVSFSKESTTHQWLNQFLISESQKMLSLPKTEQVRDGRQFMPFGQYERLEATNLREADKYFTFSDSEVSGMIARRGVVEYNRQLEKLQKSGFERKTTEKKSSTSEVENKSEGQQTSAPSPKATGHTMGGAGSESDKNKMVDAPAHLAGVFKSFGD